MSRTLRLVDYDPGWPQRFRAESGRIAETLKGLAVAIEHVGSTAVPDLPGKPVLDIAVAVRSEQDADACITPIVTLGYVFRGQHGDDPRRRYYVRDREGQRTSQIHLFILPAAGWDDQLAFRNALRESRDLAEAYAAEKLRVATEVGWNKLDYSKAKGPFIETVLASLNR